MIRVIQGLEELKKLRAVCDELAYIHATPFLRHEWIEACVMNLCPPGTLRILVAESGGEVTALAPLVRIGSPVTPHLEILGASAFGSGSGILFYRNEPALLDILDAFASFRLPVYLSGVRTASIDAVGLESSLRKQGLHFYVKRELTPWIEFAEDQDLLRIPVHRRKYPEDEPPLRPVAENIGLTSEVHTPERQELESVLKMMQVPARRSDGEACSGKIAYDGNLIRFLIDLAELSTGTGMLKVCYLHDDGRIGGVMSGIEYSNRFWLLGISWAKRPSQPDADIILTRKFIRYAFNSRFDSLEQIDFNRPWLEPWTDRFHDYSSYRIYDRAAETVLAVCGELLTSITGKFLLGFGSKSRVNR